MHGTLRGARWLSIALGLGLLLAGCAESKSRRVGEVGERDGGRGDGGGGQGGGDDDDDDGDDDVAPLRLARITSAPTTFALVGERYVYRPRSNGVALTQFSLAEAPANMSIARGQIEWTPSPAQGRVAPHRVTVRGSDGTREVEQTFELTVATATEVARRSISTGGGGMMMVDRGPLSGAGVNVARGSISATANVTVSELSAAPALPNMVGSSRAARFGPSGATFGSPATIMLPLPGDTSITEANLSAYVWNPEGRWQRVQVLAIDREQHVMIARARHFSIYVAAQSRLGLSTRLSTSGAQTACAGGVSAYAELADELEKATISSINNLPVALIPAGRDPAVAPVVELLQPKFQGSLRVVHVFELVEPHDGAELAHDQRVLVTTVWFPGDGEVTITHADALGKPLGAAHFSDLVGQIGDIRARLRGAPLAGHFGAAPAPGLAIAARVHLAYFADDVSRDPVDVEALGLAATERGAKLLGGDPIADDVDCDGLRDAYDPADDRAHPRVELAPSAARTLLAGEALTLHATLRDGDASAMPTWSVIGPDDATRSVLTEIQGNPGQRIFQASQAGVYAVRVRYAWGAEVLESAFALSVIEPAPWGNLSPTCVPTKPVAVARALEPVALAANVADAETPASGLRVRWGLVTGGASPQLIDAEALTPRGAFALFTPPGAVAGAYTLGCQAFDGTQWGDIGTVSLPVVGAKENRPPEALTVTPVPTQLQVEAGVTLQAFARDPDPGSTLTYEWEAENALRLDRDTSDPTGPRRRVVASELPGSGKVKVKVSDGKASETLELTIQVVARADAGTATRTLAGGLDAGVLDGGQP